jgi:hypothetical protein
MELVSAGEFTNAQGGQHRMQVSGLYPQMGGSPPRLAPIRRVTFL